MFEAHGGRFGKNSEDFLQVTIHEILEKYEFCKTKSEEIYLKVNRSGWHSPIRIWLQSWRYIQSIQLLGAMLTKSESENQKSEFGCKSYSKYPALGAVPTK